MTGSGTANFSNPFWDVQHTEQSERGPVIRPAWNVPGQYGPETKLAKRIYRREYSGYKVVATEALSAHSGGLTIFYRTGNTSPWKHSRPTDQTSSSSR